MKKILFVLLAITVMFSAFAAETQGRLRTQFVSTTNFSPFPTSGSVVVHEGKSFCASFDGSFTVMTNGVVLHRVLVCEQALTGIAVDGTNIYVSCRNGEIYVYDKITMAFKTSHFVYALGINSIVMVGDSLFVSLGFTEMAVTSERVFVSEVSSGRVVLELNKHTFQTNRIFGQTFEPKVTVAFARDGTRMGSITNPPTIYGQVEGAILCADSNYLVQTATGSRGSGVYVSDARTLQPLTQIDCPSANVTAMLDDHRLVIGTEGGVVDVVNVTNPVPRLARISLCQATTNTLGAVEARSLKAANGIIYVGCSGGNPTNRGPSYFELRYDEAPLITRVAKVAGGTELNFVGRAGQSFEVQATTDFITWVNIGSAQVGTNCVFTDTNISPSGVCFYRARCP